MSAKHAEKGRGRDSTVGRLMDFSKYLCLMGNLDMPFSVQDIAEQLAMSRSNARRYLMAARTRDLVEFAYFRDSFTGMGGKVAVYRSLIHMQNKRSVLMR